MPVCVCVCAPTLPNGPPWGSMWPQGASMDTRGAHRAPRAAKEVPRGPSVAPGRLLGGYSAVPRRPLGGPSKTNNLNRNVIYWIANV